jgi:transposase-like protein
MRYPASEKLEIIRVVEESALPVRRTLEKIGIPRATFYRWYDLYQAGGPEAPDDRHPKPDRVWNRIPDEPLECREYSYEPDMCGVIRYFTTTSEHPARSRSA